MIAPIRRRLAMQHGFTLVELLVAMTIGMIVLSAALTLIDSGGRANARLIDKAETVQRARIGMDRIVRVLRTQTCADGSTPPLIAATVNSVTFYSDTSTDSGFRPRRVRLTFPAGEEGPVVQDTWENTNTTATPSSTRQLLERVSRVPSTTGEPPTAFLTYYSWEDPKLLTPPLDDTFTSNTVSSNSVAKVVRIDVSLQAGPTSGNKDPVRRTAMTSPVYTRNADFSGQDNPGRVWGPRCA